jgi:single-strand DNA-binding protein
MASDLNRVIIIGRLTKDPDLRYTQSGSSVASFSVANNRSYTSSGGEKKEVVSYFNCVAWGKLGELLVQYCKKGHRIGLEGRLQQRSWEDQNGNKRSTVEVIVENFQFLQPKAGAGAAEEGMEMPPAAPDTEANPFSDDDIPF